MKTFSIKELETLCGVKAHTIRVWEKRYNVFQPQRTPANARRYTAADLAKLLNFVLLTNSGCKISSLSQLSAADIQQRLRHLAQNDERIQKAVHELIRCMYTIDVDGFESTLDTSFLSWPVDTVVQEIIYPFLQKVGLLCHGTRQNEEHFVVTAVRKKLYWSIQRTVSERKRNKTVLLFLSGERQLDLLLLYVYCLLEGAGWHVIHLGADVSAKNLEDFLRVQKVDFLLSYFQKKPAFSLADFSARMEALAPQTKLLMVKGEKCFSADTTANVIAVDTAEVLDFLSAAQEGEAATREALELSPAL